MRRILLPALCASLLIMSSSSKLLRASLTWSLDSVTNRAEADAAANNGAQQASDGPYTVTTNPAEASATASVPGQSGHGHGLASYSFASGNAELDLSGSSDATGTLSNTGGGIGHGDAAFQADAQIGDQVLVHIVGTLTRNDDSPVPPDTFFSIGSYSKVLTTNGTLNFDDTILLFGNPHIDVEANTPEPGGNQNGSFSGSSSYMVSLTFVPAPEPSSLALFVFAVIPLSRLRPLRKTRP